MGDRRTVATPAALGAARQLQAIAQGLQPQAQQIIAQGQVLSRPDVWDGASAGRFRDQAWPQARQSLNQALRTLVQIDSHAQRVIQDIMKAGAGSLAPPAPKPKPASHGGGGWLSWGGWGWVHAALTVASFIPVVGSAAALVNAGIYAAQGDYLMAGLSALGAIPLVGDAADAISAGRLAVEGVEAASDVAQVVRVGEEGAQAVGAVEDGAQLAEQGGERALVGALHDDPAIASHAGNATQDAFDQAFPYLKDVNPQYSTNAWGFQNNCANCVIAADRDLAEGASLVSAVQVNSLKTLSYMEDAVGNGAKFRAVSGYDDITSEIAGAGDGARGIVTGFRLDAQGTITSAHAFNVINQAGKVMYLDGQIGNWANLENFGQLAFLRTA